MNQVQKKKNSMSIARCVEEGPAPQNADTKSYSISARNAKVNR